MTNIALIGYGYWGPNVAKNIYKNPNFNFINICDKRLERINLARSIYADSIQYSTDYTEVLSNKQIDAIAIAVETSAHYEIAKKALLAGKNIYIEKPFTEDTQKARELKELAYKQGLIIHVDHIMVYHPAIRKIKEIIDAGTLGDIIYFDCSRINLGNVKNDVSSMWDLSVHDLSIIDYLTNGAHVKSVSATGMSIYSQQESITFLTIEYESFLASLRASWLSPIKERKIIIAGTKKMIVYDDVDVLNKLIIYDKGFDVTINTDMEYDEFVVKSRIGDAIIPKLPIEDALYNSLEHFRNCIVLKRSSLTDADAAIRVIQILEIADKKLKSKK